MLIITLQVLFMESAYNSLVNYGLCKYSLPACGLYVRAFEVLNFDEAQIIVFSLGLRHHVRAGYGARDQRRLVLGCWGVSLFLFHGFSFGSSSAVHSECFLYSDQISTHFLLKERARLLIHL